jgi:hypothetical protein
MTAVDNGATKTQKPNARTTSPGKKVVQYEPPTEGRARNARPHPASDDPTINGSFAPYRVMRPPAQRETRKSRTGNGTMAAPAAVGV